MDRFSNILLEWIIQIHTIQTNNSKPGLRHYKNTIFPNSTNILFSSNVLSPQQTKRRFIQNHQPHFNKQVSKSWLYQQVGILMSNYREQTDYVFRKKTGKAQDQPTKINIWEIDQSEYYPSKRDNQLKRWNTKYQRKTQEETQVKISSAAQPRDPSQEYRQYLDEPKSYQYSKTSCEQFQLQQQK
ncbi:Hypothetical_protein [Hexamita inflata]|uniref:Hypothetical_protein n=1 Tax=Hexamita inflata TaxID=28002 RepID=A0AA86TDM9_9EUKA|nr:Hypothetical protein HINF_LOCUS1082 [Hexamita inflata]